MRVKALTIRILKQLKNDKRTIMLVVFAPILILTLVYYILGNEVEDYTVGIVNAPEIFVENLEQNEDYNISIKNIDAEEIKSLIDKEEIIAAIEMDEDFKDVKIHVDGTDSTGSKKIISILKSSVASSIQDSLEEDIEDTKANLEEIIEAVDSMPIKISDIDDRLSEVDLDKLSMIEPDFDTDYIYGGEELSLFDNYAAPLIGIIVFFFVYLLSGINFLIERTSGTLEKLLSTPIKTWEIVAGYVLSFSILALVQTIIITLFTIYVLDVANIGNIFYVFLVNLITAISALTLGMLLSTLANGEFQFVQFVPIVLLPQIFLCGMFKLEGIFEVISRFIPLYYTTEALKDIMLRGNGLSSIYPNLLVLCGLCFVFMGLNIKLLKKYR